MIFEEKPKLDWRSWMVQGDQYLKAGTPKGEKAKFGGEVRYNLLSMSLESYVMAIMDFHKTLPDNHTYTDLMDGLERVIPVNADLKERILKYENIQSICSVEQFHIKSPDDDQLVELRTAIVEISGIAKGICVE